MCQCCPRFPCCGVAVHQRCRDPDKLCFLVGTSCVSYSFVALSFCMVCILVENDGDFFMIQCCQNRLHLLSRALFSIPQRIPSNSQCVAIWSVVLPISRFFGDGRMEWSAIHPQVAQGGWTNAGVASIVGELHFLEVGQSFGCFSSVGLDVIPKLSVVRRLLFVSGSQLPLCQVGHGRTVVRVW